MSLQPANHIKNNNAENNKNEADSKVSGKVMGQQKAVACQDAQAIQNRLNWHALEDLVIIRLLYGAEEGETEVALRKDLHPLVMQQMSAGEWRNCLGQIIVSLVNEGFMRPVRANAYMVTEHSQPRALKFLKLSNLPKTPWHEIRDGYLIAISLGLQPARPLVARLTSAEGLRSILLTLHYNLPYDIASVTVDQIRLGLAKIAEGRGLTSGIRTTPVRENITQKEAVMMGSKLLKSGHVVESDGELLACLAQEVVGAVNESAAELRQMLFRQLISSRESSEVQKLVKAPGQIQDLSPTGAAECPEREPPPPLPEFTDGVMDIAKSIAVGWPGNKRAFISHIWQELRQRYPEWQFTEDEYKEMIVSAQRAGLLRLAIADLRDKTNVDDVAKSRVSYKNSEWHFIRVDSSNE